MKNRAFQDFTGQRFGKLIALSYTRKPNEHGIFWNCKCDCGNTSTVISSRLKSGRTKSCGCLTVEILKTSKPGIKHGLYLTKLYAVWDAMKQRCRNSKNKSFPNYGGRGIVICHEWNDFQNFYDWAISHGYEEGLSIDRIDNDGNYCPENCQWLTRSENSSKGSRRIEC